MQEALENRKLELGKVDTATNPADVCTKALPGNGICELCRLARCAYAAVKKTCDDPDEWYLSRLDELCRCENGSLFVKEAHLARVKHVLFFIQLFVVDFTCLSSFNQPHFASDFRHELVDPKCRKRSIMEKGFM